MKIKQSIKIFLKEKNKNIQILPFRIYRRCKGQQHKYASNLFIHIGILFIVAYSITAWIEIEKNAPKISEFIVRNKIFAEIILTAIVITIYSSIWFLCERFELALTAKGAGLFFFSPNKTSKTITDGYQFLVEHSLIAAHIRVQGATGWDTFGHPDSPLYTAMETCNEAEIILFNPQGDAINQRVEDINDPSVTVESYRQEIYNSIKRLKAIQDKGNKKYNIKLKFYNRYPTWKFIILDKYVWVQRYPTDNHVKNIPCFAFGKLSHNSGLYEPFSEQFLGYWNSNRLGTYDFASGMIKYDTYRKNPIGPPEIIKELTK